MKKILFLGYFITLHLVLGMLIFRPQLIEENRWRLGLPQPEPSAFAEQLHRMYMVADKQAPDGRMVLVGDSQFQRIPGDLLPKNALNLGIGGDTVRHMASRANDYQSLSRAKSIFIWGGLNDLERRSPSLVAKDMRLLLDNLPPNQPVYLLGLAPIRSDNSNGSKNRTISDLNHRYSTICQKACQFIAVDEFLSNEQGFLKSDFDAGDGIHLSRAGYETVFRLIADTDNNAKR